MHTFFSSFPVTPQFEEGLGSSIKSTNREDSVLYFLRPNGKLDDLAIVESPKQKPDTEKLKSYEHCQLTAPFPGSVDCNCCS